MKPTWMEFIGRVPIRCLDVKGFYVDSRFPMSLAALRIFYFGATATGGAVTLIPTVV